MLIIEKKEQRKCFSAKYIILDLTFGIMYDETGNEGRNCHQFGKQKNILQTTILTIFLACLSFSTNLTFNTFL